MYTLKVTGPDRAVDFIKFLKKKGWDFDIKINPTDPFSRNYDIIMNNREQAFMAQLALGA